MARQDALNIYANGEKDKLAEVYGGLLEAVQKGAVSEQIKNKNYSGNPTSGTVEIDRFKNAVVADLGTARTGGKGAGLDNRGKVVVSVDTRKESVEELAKDDVDLFGLAGMAEKRKVNHTKRMIAYLDSEFFACAEREGTKVELSADTVAGKVEELILAVETTKNDYVDGVDRDMIVVTVSPAVYSAIQNYIDSVPNSISGLREELFHKVRIFSNHRQTKPAIAMIDGAVAQLVKADQYEAEKIPLSNDIALELFFSKGTKAVMPDLIKYADTF